MNTNKSGKISPKLNWTSFMLRIALMILLLVLMVVLSEQVPARGAPNPENEGGIEPPPDWDVILQEPFDDNDYDWPVGVEEDRWARSNWQLINGVFRWEIKAKQYVYWYAYPNHGPLDDFYLGVDIRKVSGAEDAIYGVVYRVEDNNNLYFLQIYDPWIYALWRIYNGEWLELIDWSKAGDIHPGQFNRIEVLAEGSEFSFAINGQKVGTASDDRLEVGGIGIAIQLFAKNDQAIFEFDNLVIRAPVKADSAAEGVPSDLEKGIEQLVDELEKYREVGDIANEGKSLNNLGHLYYEMGDNTLATEYMQQAISVFESIGEDWRTAYPLDGLGMVYRSMGEDQKSLDYYERAL
ncbi:MAG: tetratricopeptide repeat protein, partial [Anaerolineales bacterium]|nr:tetratricopeptide repeat protein [Anaerolineales bacterium]